MQSSLSLSRVPGIPPGRLLAQQPCSLIPLRHIVCPQAGCRIQPSRSSASRSSQASFRFLEAEDSSEQVRAIIEAFPSLEYLSIRVQEAEREVIERWDYLEHSLLLLEYRHIWSIARALVKLSSVRNVCYGSLTSGNFSLQQTPKAFPVLGRLRIQCSGGKPIYLYPQDEARAKEEQPVLPIKNFLCLGSLSWRCQVISRMPFSLEWMSRGLMPPTW